MSPLAREPIAISRLVEFLALAILCVTARYSLGRSLEWTEVLGLAALVGIGQTAFARGRVTPLADPKV